MNAVLSAQIDPDLQETAPFARECCSMLREDPDGKVMIDVLRWARAMPSRDNRFVHEALPMAYGSSKPSTSKEQE